MIIMASQINGDVTVCYTAALSEQEMKHQLIESNAAYMRHQTRPSLVQIMTCQAIIWSNTESLSNRPMQTYFSEILIKMQWFSLKKMHLKMILGISTADFTNGKYTVGEIRSTLSTSSKCHRIIYRTSSTNATRSFVELHKAQMPLEHLSYIKERAWNTSGGT